MTDEEDKTLRDTVPDDFRLAASPIGCVQNYICALEKKLEQLGVDLDDVSFEFLCNP